METFNAWKNFSGCINREIGQAAKRGKHSGTSVDTVTNFHSTNLSGLYFRMQTRVIGEGIHFNISVNNYIINHKEARV